MISYYELLGMIKDGKAPNKIRVHLTSEPREYRMIFDCGECNYYELIGNENNDYKYYLSDSYLESMMFDKTIEILDEKKIPEKLDYCDENTFMFKCKENSYLTREEMRLLDSNFKELGNKINSIIDYLQSKGNE